MLICLGGGVITDMGGFAAATYMRGMQCLNIPTTLLGMVDAATGGKTGVDFNGIKNLIGVFRQPKETIIHPPFLRTLPAREFLSGWAEMVKHTLISSFNRFITIPTSLQIAISVFKHTVIHFRNQTACTYITRTHPLYTLISS